MTSERAILANQQNAKASTGPRTASGKKRAAQNALKHGLSAAVANLIAEEETERLIQHLVAGNEGDPAFRKAARELAEAQANLRRVLLIKRTMVEEAMHAGAAQMHPEEISIERGATEILQRLERLERYERRAFSRRNSTARRLNAQIAF
ncbi:hypothetical protein [Methylobacterium oxalidis]|uniref:hypothetical protein n=1 Tax=Methylobacterium oxalidis TaxID=944322 RepID=UPI0033149764